MEEDKKRKLPSNWEAKKARLEWELAEDHKKKVTPRGAVLPRLHTVRVLFQEVARFQRYNSAVTECNLVDNIKSYDVYLQFKSNVGLKYLKCVF